jgi:hypothetical protein
MKSYQKVLLLVLAINFLIATTLSLKLNENSSKNLKRGEDEEHQNLFKQANMDLNLNQGNNIAKNLPKTFNNMKNTEKALIDCLFEKPEKTNCDCEGNIKTLNRVKKTTTSTKVVAGITITIPKSKSYPFTGIDLFGFGKSAYIFDYLDSVFQFDAVYQFIEVYWQIFKVEFKSEADPYWEEYLTGKKTVFSGTHKEQKIKIDFTIDLLKEKNEFIISDPNVYKVSVTLPQLEFFFKQWGWQFEGKSEFDSPKHFLDEYDFNGDGRLSPRELIFGVIMENFDNETCTFCLQDLKLKFNVMFKYMKCYSENHLLVVQMAKKLKYVKRQSKKEYNLYTCQSESFINECASDFFTSSHEFESFEKEEELTVKRKDRLDILGFRKGLLLGFWNRQVSDAAIYASSEIIAKYESEYNTKIENREAFILEVDERNKKNDRWAFKITPNDCPPAKIDEPPKDCY